jgi:hypothetical protein
MVEVPLTPKPESLPSESLPSYSLQSESLPSYSLTEGFKPNDAGLYAYTPVKPYRVHAEDVLENKERKAELMAIFRKDRCVDGRLVHRGMDVKSEMADHLFREIRFDDETHKCNVCDPHCGFSIIEEKLAKESELTLPKSANDAWTFNLDYVAERITATTNWLNQAIPLNTFVSV